MSDMPDEFDDKYYDEKYFVTKDGKRYSNVDGSVGAWSYANVNAEWFGCGPIVNVWKEIFGLISLGNDNSSKVLDVGCGRGTFVGWLRSAEIETFGFDYSKWAVEHPYFRCQPGWIVLHDATKQFPYGGCPFDLVIVLDLMEHIYYDDIDKVIGEIYRVSKRWVFLQIATVSGSGESGESGGSSGSSGSSEIGYILKKGEKIPVELQGVAVAGHVTVQNRLFWVDKLLRDGSGNERKWILRDDLVEKFKTMVPSDIIANWVKNTIIILEKI